MFVRATLFRGISCDARNIFRVFSKFLETGSYSKQTNVRPTFTRNPTQRKLQDNKELKISSSIGESGLGKSTLINSMFLADIYSAEYPGPSHRVKKTVAVETSKVLLKENGVNLTLTVVDTPGFGDAVDNSNW